MRSSEQKLLIGVDVGGTNLKAAVMDSRFQRLAQRQFPTQTCQSPDVLCNVLSAVEALLKEINADARQVSAIGVDFPGMVDPKEKQVLRLTPLNWSDVPIAPYLQRSFPGAGLAVENDGTAALLGEKYFGAAYGHENIVMLVLGTGIGGAVMADGRILRGCSGVAGEVGHMSVNDQGPRCSCGRRGCIQAYAGAQAILRRARDGLAQWPDSPVWDLCGGDPAAVSIPVLGRGFSLGDAFCRECFSFAAHYLAQGVVNYVRIFNPSLVVIGGGLSNLEDPLMAPLLEEVQQQGFMHPRQQCAVVRGELREWAGAYGCCALAAMEAGIALP